MKLNKKLLVFALSVLMLVGLLAVAAFAAGESDVLTIKYMDGTVQTYAKGETVIPPAVPAQYVAYDADGKAYLYTVTGTAWEGIPATVTADHLGKTIKATVAATKGADQIFYSVATSAEGTPVYKTTNDANAYITSGNCKSSVWVKLYADVTANSFATGTDSSGYSAYLDLNGHTVSIKNTMKVTYTAIFYIYSSKPGAHFYSSADYMIYTDNNGRFALGDDGSGKYVDNISFHAKIVAKFLWANGGAIIGGSYYQTQAGVAFMDVARRMREVKNAKFYVAPGTPAVFAADSAFTGTTPELNYVSTGSPSISNCVFYAPESASIIYATAAAKLKFDNCTFINVSVESTVGSASVLQLTNCVSNIPSASVFGSDVLANVGESAYNGLVDAEGNPIAATVSYEMTPVANTLKVNSSAGASYWAVGTTFNVSAGDYVQLKAGGILLTNPEYDLAGVAEIVDGKVAAAGEITLTVVFRGQTIAAFTYKDTASGKLYGVSYEECGSTAAGVFEKFYELFNDPASAYEITMYRDMIVNKAIGFGSLVKSTYKQDETVSYNADYYNSLAKGDIVWDLNGTTVTISAETSSFINPASSNFKDGTSTWNSGNAACIFGFEGQNATAVFTLKSSKAGAKIVNEATHSKGVSIFGLGERRSTRLVIDGTNLTIDAGAGFVYFGIEVDSATAANPRLAINGGTYITNSTAGAFQFSGGATIANATIIASNASISRLTVSDTYRDGTVAFDNVIFIASKDTAPAYYSSSSKSHNVSFNDCAYIGCEPTSLERCAKLNSLTYTGVNLASTEENLALINASAPAGTAKYTFKLAANDQIYTLLGYASADQVLAVTYGETGITENYLVGKAYAPLAMSPAYFEIVFDLVNGTANIPVAWAGIPAAGIVDATYGGQTVTATPADNILAIAYALVENDIVTAYALADAAEIGAAMKNAVAALKDAGVLYLYQDIEVEQLVTAKDLTVELNGKKLTSEQYIFNNNTSSVLTFNNGEIVIGTLDTSFMFYGDAAFNNVKLYVDADVYVFFGFVPVDVALNNVVIVNESVAAIGYDANVAINGAKLVNVVLDENATVVGGTVLATEAFAGAKFADGVYGDLIVNNNKESLTVADKTVEAVYVVAATADAAKAIEIVYVFDGVVRGRQNYYYGSVASFYSEFTEGYYFAYTGTNALTKAETFECSFHADDSKLKAQVVLTDALNYTFYLQVEDAGVLANLKLNGVALDLDVLRQVTFEDGSKFYVIPVAFETFADALDAYVLSVDLVGAESSLTITAEASLDQYLAEVLAIADEKDAKLAYAVTEYVEALMNYFNYDLAYGDIRLKNLARIGNLLADYAEYKTDLAELPAETLVASNYVKSVVLVADEKITFAFRVANSFAGTIEINGVAVELSKPFEGFDRTYALAEVALEDLDEAITVTVLDAAGEVVEEMTYALADYIAGVAAQNSGVVADYAKALWKLATVVGASDRVAV